MKVELHMDEQDSLLLQGLLNTKKYGSVDDLLLTALHRLAEENDEDTDSPYLVQAARDGLNSGWHEGDPFQAARQVLADAAKQELNAA